jgi:hypothetical protein
MYIPFDQLIVIAVIIIGIICYKRPAKFGLDKITPEQKAEMIKNQLEEEERTKQFREDFDLYDESPYATKK